MALRLNCTHPISSLAQVFAVTTWSNSRCFKCVEIGHWKGGCPQKGLNCSQTSQIHLSLLLERQAFIGKRLTNPNTTMMAPLHLKTPCGATLSPASKREEHTSPLVTYYIGKYQPKLSIKIDNKSFKYLVDTGQKRLS